MDIFSLVLIGLDENLLHSLMPALGSLAYKHLSQTSEVESFLENCQLKPGASVIVSNDLVGMSVNEVAQSFNSYYVGLKIIFITKNRDLFNIEELRKNGFSDCFLLPTDRKSLIDFIDSCKSTDLDTTVKRYKQVKLVDIEPGEFLPFSLRSYLPMNDKYILLTASGKISGKKSEKLKNQDTKSVFIDVNEIDKFYEFSAEKLIKLGKTSNDAISATEKAEQLQSNIRKLFKTVLTSGNNDTNFESGRDLLEQSKKIVESYVLRTTGLDLQIQFRQALGDSNCAYTHAQSVSTVACLLSMATGIGHPEDLAIAGLFHDIGMHGLSNEVSIFDWPGLEIEQQKIYEMHPHHSLNLLKEKKITLTNEIAEMIEKHHERTDGSGFPAKLPAHKIPETAQLLGYADAFEYLSRPTKGRQSPTPLEIHKMISDSLKISFEILNKLQKFLKGIETSN